MLTTKQVHFHNKFCIHENHISSEKKLISYWSSSAFMNCIKFIIYVANDYLQSYNCQRVHKDRISDSSDLL